MASIVVGTVVQLKSGGPPMTVMDIYEGKEVRCQWFSGADVKDAYFPLDSLIEVQRKS